MPYIQPSHCSQALLPDSQSILQIFRGAQQGGFGKFWPIKARFSEQSYSKCPLRYGHAETHLLALTRVRNTAETLHSIQAFSKIMLTHLPLCAPVMEAFPAELSVFLRFHN